MKAQGSFLTLTLLVALAAAPGHAQDIQEECPNLKGRRPSPEELQEKVRAHQEWIDNYRGTTPAVSGRAVLCNADLSNANLSFAPLRDANLAGANLTGANLTRANLTGADLTRANLTGADLTGANLTRANLTGANLTGADLTVANLDRANLFRAELEKAHLYEAKLNEANLVGAKLNGANLGEAELNEANLIRADLIRANLVEAELRNTVLARTDLTGAVYAPGSPPPAVYVTGIKGLKTVTFPLGEEIGLVQLRKLLQDGGLRDLEREATYAIERNKTRHLLFKTRHLLVRELQAEEPDQAEEQSLRWREPLKLIEGGFRLVAFHWPVAYGLHPGRALLILFASIGAFALVYLIPLSRGGTGGIHRVWPEGRLEARSSTAEVVGRIKVERLRPRGLWGLKRLLRALQFSLLSAFHLGWRELNVGNWIARVQAREYTLRATGWVRVVAGAQSLLSVYLLALWALTYFGRPFG